jgi:hypothetical protein
MTLREELFQPVDPFKKQAPWFSRQMGKGPVNYSIRPVCLLMDLKLLYEWRNAAGFIRPDPPLIMHYKKLLVLSDRQALVIEKEGIPVCEFDIMPSQLDEIHLRFHTGPDDHVLHDLRSTARYGGDNFRESLKIFLDYYYRFSDAGALFLPVSAADSESNQQVQHAGFYFVARLNLRSGPANLYRAWNKTWKEK